MGVVIRQARVVVTTTAIVTVSHASRLIRAKASSEDRSRRSRGKGTTREKERSVIRDFFVSDMGWLGRFGFSGSGSGMQPLIEIEPNLIPSDLISILNPRSRRAQTKTAESGSPKKCKLGIWRVTGH